MRNLLGDVAFDIGLQMRKTVGDLALGEVLVAVVDRLELTAIDGHAVALQRADPAAEFYELRAGLANGSTIHSHEIRNGLVIRHQPPEQAHYLDIAPSLALQPAAGGDPVEIAIDEQLQQHRRMVFGPPCPGMSRAPEAKFHQIKLVNKQITRPNQVILVDPVLKTVQKRRHLIPIKPFNEARHRCTPVSPEACHIWVFSHCLGSSRRSAGLGARTGAGPPLTRALGP